MASKFKGRCQKVLIKPIKVQTEIDMNYSNCDSVNNKIMLKQRKATVCINNMSSKEIQ